MNTNSFRNQHGNQLGRWVQVTGSASAKAKSSGAIGAARVTQYFNTPGSEQTEHYLGRGHHKRMLPKVKQICPHLPVATILGIWKLLEK